MHLLFTFALLLFQKNGRSLLEFVTLEVDVPKNQKRIGSMNTDYHSLDCLKNHPNLNGSKVGFANLNLAIESSSRIG
jgi:hypothetical protein